MFTILAYLLGGLPMVWAILQVRAVHAIPGNEFASMMTPGIVLVGTLGSTLFGMSFALLGHARREPKALIALWLVPVLAVAVAFSGFVHGFIFF